MGALWPHNTPATAENGLVPLSSEVRRVGSTSLTESGDVSEWSFAPIDAV